MLEDIMYTFENNIVRINNLLSIYKSISVGKGRKSINSLDILRATTVLVHSTLEDYLRNILIWKLPFQEKEKLNQISLVGTSDKGRITKFTLGDLVLHKDKSVNEIINSSVLEYLSFQSFNNSNDVANAISSISLNNTSEIKLLFSTLDIMIKRRHNIVHNADREIILNGSGNHRITSISLLNVEKWKKTVDKLVKEINKNFIH